MKDSLRVSVREILQRWSWLLAGLAAPIFLLPDPNFAWALMVMPLILGIQAWAWRKILPMTPFNLPLLLISGALAVSLGATPNLAFSLPKITGLLLGILTFMIVARYSETRAGWLVALGGFFLVGIGISAIGFLGADWFTQKFTVLNSLIASLPRAIRGLPGAENGIQPNELAGALIWVFPAAGFAGVALLRDKTWFSGPASVKGSRLRQIGWGVFLIGTLLFTLLAWFLAQSRGAYFAIVLTGLSIGLALLPRRIRELVIGLIILIGLAGFWFVAQVGWQTILANFANILPFRDSAFSLDSMAGRLEIWSRAVWALRAAPLTGLGMNTFREAVLMIFPMFNFPASYNFGHAHNEFIQVALDLGLPGLLAYLALHFTAFSLVMRIFRTGGAVRWLALGLGSGLLAHIFYGLTDAVALGAKPGILFWWLLGLIYGLYRQAQVQANPKDGLVA